MELYGRKHLWWNVQVVNIGNNSDGTHFVRYPFVHLFASCMTFDRFGDWRTEWRVGWGRQFARSDVWTIFLPVAIMMSGLSWSRFIFHIHFSTSRLADRTNFAKYGNGTWVLNNSLSDSKHALSKSFWFCTELKRIPSLISLVVLEWQDDLFKQGLQQRQLPEVPRWTAV